MTPFESAWSRPLHRRTMLGLLAAGAGALATACASGTSRSAPSSTTTTFPLGAAAKASSKPVPITLWHSMTDVNQTVLQTLTNAFNTSQSDVRVSLVNQSSYDDTLTLYTAALSGGTLPDLVQMETVDLQLMIDSRSIVAAQSAIDADHFDMSDFLPAARDFFVVDGTQWAMPFNLSTNILYYDKSAFSRAGLDPDTPPADLDDMRTMAQTIVSSGTEHYGASLKLDAAYPEQWLAIENATLVNDGNGRQGRATAVTFGGSSGAVIFDWMADMLHSKLAQGTLSTNYDNLYAIANKIAPMALETSAALGTVESLLSSYPEVKLGVGPTPRTTATSTGGMFVGGAGLYMVNHSSPEKQDAAWQFIKFLVEPDQLNTWAVGTGYVPIRVSAAQAPAITTLWDQHPEFKVAYDQVASSPATLATAGAVAGPLSQMGTDINSALTTMTTGASGAQALAQAVKACNQDLSSYNARLT